jgi:hypothetical protein
MMRFVQSYARAHANAYPHTPTRTHTGSSLRQTEYDWGVVPADCVHDSAIRVPQCVYLCVLHPRPLRVRALSLTSATCLALTLSTLLVAESPELFAHIFDDTSRWQTIFRR